MERGALPCHGRGRGTGAGSLSAHSPSGRISLLPEVGSRLYLLSRARPSARGALGASYAAEALAGEENLRVLGAVWTEETRTLTVELEWQGEPMQAVLDAAALGWQDRQEDRQEAGSI